MKYIDSIIDIPEFIKRYIDKKETYCWLQASAHNMCKTLMDLHYHELITGGLNRLITDIALDEDAKRFLDFYFLKIRIDRRGFCPYEEELDFPESIRNEVFKAIVDGEEKILFIDSYENGRLTLIEVR